MPYVFRFHGHDRQWEGPLQIAKCAHATCEETVSIGLPYCAVHLLSNYKLKVRPSYIPGAGLGLICTDGDDIIDLSQPLIRKNALICPYYGEGVTEAVCQARYGDRDDYPYVAQLSGDSYEDGALRRGAGSLVNHAASDKANAMLCVHQGRIWLRAVKNLYDEMEVLINYTPNVGSNRYDFTVQLHETIEVESVDSVACDDHQGP